MNRVRPLLLASTSKSRQLLLNDARIPYKLIGQQADESRCDWTLPLQKLVEAIACYKMQQAEMPDGKEGEVAFVLTADTLSSNVKGDLCGKPSDKSEAIMMLKGSREGIMRTGTAFCLEKKIFCSGVWKTKNQILRFVEGRYTFVVPDQWLKHYLDCSIAYSVTAAIGIEGYGNLFLRDVQGSYSAIRGLPLYELREELEKIGFFDSLL